MLDLVFFFFGTIKICFVKHVNDIAIKTVFDLHMNSSPINTHNERRVVYANYSLLELRDDFLFFLLFPMVVSLFTFYWQ